MDETPRPELRGLRLGGRITKEYLAALLVQRRNTETRTEGIATQLFEVVRFHIRYFEGRNTETRTEGIATLLGCSARALSGRARRAQDETPRPELRGLRPKDPKNCKQNRGDETPRPELRGLRHIGRVSRSVEPHDMSQDETPRPELRGLRRSV